MVLILLTLLIHYWKIPLPTRWKSPWIWTMDDSYHLSSFSEVVCLLLWVSQTIITARGGWLKVMVLNSMTVAYLKGVGRGFEVKVSVFLILTNTHHGYASLPPRALSSELYRWTAIMSGTISCHRVNIDSLSQSASKNRLQQLNCHRYSLPLKDIMTRWVWGILFERSVTNNVVCQLGSIFLHYISFSFENESMLL